MFRTVSRSFCLHYKVILCLDAIIGDLNCKLMNLLNCHPEFPWFDVFADNRVPSYFPRLSIVSSLNCTTSLYAPLRIALTVGLFSSRLVAPMFGGSRSAIANSMPEL